MANAMLIELTETELNLLQEALDSHEYWQLSEPSERNDGYSLVEDGENEEIDATRALSSKLARALEASQHTRDTSDQR